MLNTHSNDSVMIYFNIFLFDQLQKSTLWIKPLPVQSTFVASSMHP